MYHDSLSLCRITRLYAAVSCFCSSVCSCLLFRLAIAKLSFLSTPWLNCVKDPELHSWEREARNLGLTKTPKALHGAKLSILDLTQNSNKLCRYSSQRHQSQYAPPSLPDVHSECEELYRVRTTKSSWPFLHLGIDRAARFAREQELLHVVEDFAFASIDRSMYRRSM